MSSFLPERPHRREPFSLQLTALIDVFSMIVIFLILGTVFGAAEMVLPAGVTLPWSISKESADLAPRLTIGKDFVEVNVSDVAGRQFPISEFRQRDEKSQNFGAIPQLKMSLQKYVSELSKMEKDKGVFLNIIADASTPYADVFDVVRVFRESGFEGMLFVAAGEAKK